jgi:hypothetical protein
MREQEVREYLTDMGLDYDDFLLWMRVRTVGAYDDGSTNYYGYDVERWVDAKLKGKELVWD